MKKKYNVKEEKQSQLELTWQTHYLWYEIGIKKIRILKERSSKTDQSSIIKKNVKKPELTRGDFTNMLSE